LFIPGWDDRRKMSILDENEVMEHILTYYNNPKLQGKIINDFLDELTPIIKKANKSKRTRLGNAESRAEAVYPLLVQFRRIIAINNPSGFLEGFKAGLNAELQKYSARRPDQRNKASLEGANPIDPDLNPEELCLEGNQVDIAKAFLKRKCSNSYGDMIIRHHLEGQSLDEVGAAYGMSGNAVGKRIRPYLQLLKTYMKRVNK
jgi:hypothetical protein